MKKLVFILFMCTSCLCSKHHEEYHKKHKAEKVKRLDKQKKVLSSDKHDDTNPATSYKGNKTPKSLVRPDTRGHDATG